MANMSDLLPMALMVLVAIIALGIGTQVIASVASENCASGYTYNETRNLCVNSTSGWSSGAGETTTSNITSYGVQTTGELASWTPTIALVFAAALIIGTLVYSFGFRN